ncbi:MAG: hypothetical protein WA231_00285 [Methylocella sp.]
MTPTKPPKLKKPSQPPKSKAWDAPPFPEKGDDDERSTFEWVGRALSEWERFESFFGLSFGVFVGSYDGLAPAMRAYGAIVSFRGRLEMIKAAADAHFAKHPHGGTAIFKHICEMAEGFSARRNEIAHGVVQLYYPDGKQSSGSALGPSRHFTKKQKLTKKDGESMVTISPTYAYTAIELIRFTRDFHLLAQQTKGFHRNLAILLREKLKTSP